MRRLYCAAVFMLLNLLAVSSVFAGPARIAVLDFKQEPDSRSFKTLGKGLAELLSLELSLSRDLAVTGRAERIKALLDISFGPPEKADRSKQLLAGVTMGCRYIVTGAIVERTDVLAVAVTLLDVPQGAAVFSAREAAAPEEYDYIVAVLAGKILAELKLPVPVAVRAKAAANKSRTGEAAAPYLTMVEAMDQGDAARMLDPDKAMARFYLSKLVVNMTKFGIVDEIMFSGTNPAYLGVMQYDQIQLSSTIPTQSLGAVNEDKTRENDFRANLGYQVPIGTDFGLEIMTLVPDYRMHDSAYDWTRETRTPWDVRFGQVNLGGVLGLGWAPVPTFSCGLGVSLVYRAEAFDHYSNESNNQYVSPAFSLGVLFKNAEATELFDVMAGYAPGRNMYFTNLTVDHVETLPPLYLGGTLTLALADYRLFLVFRQLNEITLDWQYYFGRLSAATEYWFTDWFAARVSLEGSFRLPSGVGGVGANIGITIRIPGLGGLGWSGWDFNITASARERPSRLVVDDHVAEYYLTVCILKTGSFVMRPADLTGINH